jgi:hypothetical protein
MFGFAVATNPIATMLRSTVYELFKELCYQIETGSLNSFKENPSLPEYNQYVLVFNRIVEAVKIRGKIEPK